jgi:hypothetical protein
LVVVEEEAKVNRDSNAMNAGLLHRTHGSNDSIQLGNTGPSLDSFDRSRWSESKGRGQPVVKHETVGGEVERD